MKKTGGGGGSTAKHSGTTSKHQVHHRAKTKHKNPPAKAKTTATGHGTATTVAKHPHHARARTLGEGIGLCPAEAVAAAARLAGWAVTGSDVLDLYARCADGPSSGFTIAAALTASPWPCDFSAYTISDFSTPPVTCDDEHRRGGLPAGEPAPGTGVGLILGVDLPGPHAVTVAPDGCWVSWGEHYDPASFPGAVIEEAWAVSFA